MSGRRTTLGRELHPLVVPTFDALRKAGVDKWALVRPFGTGVLDVRVGRASIQRVALLVSDLFRLLEAKGVEVAVREGEPGVFCSGASRIRFKISEQKTRVRHVLTKEEEKKKNAGWSWGIPDWDYTPAGKLTFALENWGLRGVQKSWNEGARWKAEEDLGKVVEGVLVALEAQKAEDAERDRQAAIYREEQRQKEERRRLQELERRRIEALESEAARWQRAAMLRDYVAAISDAAGLADGAPDPVGLRAATAWALQVADRIDPLQSPVLLRIRQEGAAGEHRSLRSALEAHPWLALEPPSDLPGEDGEDSVFDDSDGAADP